MYNDIKTVLLFEFIKIRFLDNKKSSIETKNCAKGFWQKVTRSIGSEDLKPIGYFLTPHITLKDKRTLLHILFSLLVTWMLITFHS